MSEGDVEFLLETIKLCHKMTDKPLLIRLDSGNDSIDTVAVLMDAGCLFISSGTFAGKARMIGLKWQSSTARI